MSKGNNRDWGYASSDDKGNLTYTSYEKNGSVNRYSDNGDGGHSHEHWNNKNDYDSGKNSDWSRSESNNSKNPSTGEVQSNGGCYLTSACMKHFQEGFDDNCYELTVLRWFRDNFVSKEDIEHYYKVAPIIVEAINEEEKSDIIYDYIVVYQLRNRIKAHDNPETFDFIEKMERIKSLFIVYMDQCIKNYDLICDYYEKEFIENNIDYVTFAQRYMPNSDELNEFLSKFLQLNWKDDENQTFEYDYTKSIKFIGEAGMGKTTQMRRMYIELLKDIISGKTKKLPVWIELKNIVEETASIEGILNLTLKEYEHQYDLLFKNSVLVLFLDGYNEILEENIKRKIGK